MYHDWVKRVLIVFGMFPLVACHLVMEVPGAPGEGRCGDGTRQEGELCDGADLGEATCESMGLGVGQLACNSDCDGFDTQGCSIPDTCGDGVVDDGEGEVCDGENLGGQTCESMEMYPGELACRSDCSGFDVSGCGGTCGDGILQEGFGEECDGTVPAEYTCRGFGYFTGEPACSAACELDETVCLAATDVQAGVFHACATLTDGSIRCWGGNGSGQLGDGTTTRQLSPVAVTGVMGATAVATGMEHTCALRTDGTVWCWGHNGYGQLGDGTTDFRQHPSPVPEFGGVTRIAAGADYTCAVSAGKAYCWGVNGFGQLGIGEATQRQTSPVQVVNLDEVVAIAAGWSHTCAVLEEGSVFCWGSNSSGQLGTGNTQDHAFPVRAGSFSGAQSVACGDYHTCALSNNPARIRCWGENSDGQLGNGTSINSSTPVSVTFSVPAGEYPVHVTAGGFSTCAVLNTGTAWCWGNNGMGQLGLGHYQDQRSPVLVPGSNGLVRITAGAYFTCALNAVGNIWCWGLNEFGQLGTGNTESTLSPVQVLP